MHGSHIAHLIYARTTAIIVFNSIEISSPSVNSFHICAGFKWTRAHISHSFYVYYYKLLAHCIDRMFAVFSLSFSVCAPFFLFTSPLPHCLTQFFSRLAVCLSVLLLFRKWNHRKTLFACYATIVNHKLKTWAMSEWVTECLMHGLCDGWLAKCKGSFFLIMYDHKPLYTLSLCVCCVYRNPLQRGIPFNLSAHSHNFAVAFYWKR